MARVILVLSLMTSLGCGDDDRAAGDAGDAMDAGGAMDGGARDAGVPAALLAGCVAAYAPGILNTVLERPYQSYFIRSE